QRPRPPSGPDDPRARLPAGKRLQPEARPVQGGFPGPAKTDALDARKILELFHLKDHLPLATDVLQEAPRVPAENEKLKRLSRRRRQLVNEKVRVVNRMQSDLQAVCPELLSITGSVDNLWFLRFLSSRDDLRKLGRMRKKSVLEIPGIGKKYGGIIGEWQKRAKFSPEVEYVGPMIVSDARRILELLTEIATLDAAIEEISQESEMACRLDSIPGFGETTSAELAGEIGTIDRFDSEASLALYVGMCPLDKQSGQSHGTRTPRHVNVSGVRSCITILSRPVTLGPAFLPARLRESGRTGSVEILG
ncbi:MAG: transposase, partial [Candidatus Acetothermia bacterium]|nr:transposase [Candidatus Acetothermia bacterium]